MGNEVKWWILKVNPDFTRDPYHTYLPTQPSPQIPEFLVAQNLATVERWSAHAWMDRVLFLRPCEDACGRGLSIGIRGKYDMGLS